MKLEKTPSDYELKISHICCSKLKELVDLECFDHEEMAMGNLLLCFQVISGIIYRGIKFCPFCGKKIEIEDGKQ